VVLENERTHSLHFRRNMARRAPRRRTPIEDATNTKSQVSSIAVTDQVSISGKQFLKIFDFIKLRFIL
jgi:hypothetical protein